MIRKITKAVGRFQVGKDFDYPRDVWNTIARSAGMKLEDFSETVTAANPILQSSLKGTPKIHKRLGATQ